MAAAHEAIQVGLVPTVLEALPRVGGISRTEEHDGYRFDLGGHRFLTRMPRIRSLWDQMLGPDMLTVQRTSRIYYRDRFLHYPLKPLDTLRNVGVIEGGRMIASYLHASLQRRGDEITFEQYVTRRFGRRLYEAFFRSYTEKVWGMPCSEIRAEWASQRIQGLSLRHAILDALGTRNDVKTLSDVFSYPRLGPGMMWERFAQVIVEAGGQVETGNTVTRLRIEGARLTGLDVDSAHGVRTLSPDAVISSMPIDELITSIDPPPPEAVRDAARRLRYRSFIIVQLAVDRPGLFPYHWIYLHSPRVLAGRVQNFGNWSADLLPSPDRSSLGVEYFCTEGDRLWCLPDIDLIGLAVDEVHSLGLAERDWVLGGAVVRQSKAYPVYDQHYAACLATIRTYLGTIDNLQTIGRAGMHRYNNLDHSMLTGMLAVRNLIGENHDVWAVNANHAPATH
jgi:protoporphyrinogen oxidase